MNINTVVNEYLGTALWTEQENIVGYDILSLEAYQKATEDCQRFLDLIKAHSTLRIYTFYLADYGYDFWLTRNGHGCGFLDKPETYGMLGCQELTKLVNENFDSSNLYVGEDDLLYLT